MSNESSKLHFHFLLQDCSFCILIKMIKKRTFKITFSKDAPANSNQNSICNVKFENENALAERLFHFKLIAALFDSWIKRVRNHSNCILIFFFKTAHFVTQLKRKQEYIAFSFSCPSPAKNVPSLKGRFLGKMWVISSLLISNHHAGTAS